jgi:hypothetical protein
MALIKVLIWVMALLKGPKKRGTFIFSLPPSEPEHPNSYSTRLLLPNEIIIDKYSANGIEIK